MGSGSAMDSPMQDDTMKTSMGDEQFADMLMACKQLLASALPDNRTQRASVLA